MCTVTFFPRDYGYSLAMNRDERNSRGATPPKIETFDGVQAVYPLDVQGGTWIAANQHQASFALLNWNDVAPRAEKTHSRGAVVMAVRTASSHEEARASLEQLDLRGILPFRLIGVLGAIKKIAEWRWDQILLTENAHLWERAHWFSSSLSDENAAKERGATCQQAMAEGDAGSSAWLRRLHGSHVGGHAFSVCVHRENVSTVSYSEIQIGEYSLQFQYFAGSPCKMREFESVLQLKTTPTLSRE
jgi:hypothetical protein